MIQGTIWHAMWTPKVVKVATQKHIFCCGVIFDWFEPLFTLLDILCMNIWIQQHFLKLNYKFFIDFSYRFLFHLEFLVDSPINSSVSMSPKGHREEVNESMLTKETKRVGERNASPTTSITTFTSEVKDSDGEELSTSKNTGWEWNAFVFN